MIVNLDCKKSIDRIVYCLQNAKGSIVVCEINEYPLVFDFFEIFDNLQIDIDRIDVCKNNRYQESIRKSKSSNIFLYNFISIPDYDETETIANNINFSRDIFLSTEKNILFILPTYIVLKLMTSNVSFWSCVSLYERFVGSRSYIFEYTMYIELTGKASTIQAATEYIKYNICNDISCKKDECNFDPDSCFENKMKNEKNDILFFYYFISLDLYRWQLFDEANKCVDIILKKITDDNPLFYKVKLLKAASFYHLGNFNDSINVYNEIAKKTLGTDFYEYYYLAVFNKSIILIKHDNLVLTTDENDLFSLEESIRQFFVLDYYKTGTINDTKLKKLYYFVSYNIALFLLRQSRFQDAISVIDRANKMDTIKYSYEKTNLRLFKVFILIRLGAIKKANELLNYAKEEIEPFLGDEKLWWLKANFDYCDAFLSFVQGKYSQVFKIEKKINKILTALEKKGYLGILPYKFHFKYLKSMSVFYISENKNKASDEFKKIVKIAPSEDDLRNVNKIIRYISEYTKT